MRITQVVTTAEFAGTERYVVEVSNRLAQLGHDVAVVGGHPETMPALLAGVAWRPGATAATSLRSLLAGGRRDIVHSHIAKSDFVAAMAGPVTGGGRVSTRHITAPRGYSPLARKLGVPVRARLAREIAVSEWTSTQLDRPADCVLLNGVADQPAATDVRDPVVLVAQRLAPEKQTETAVRAWAKSGLADWGWRMAIAGDGSERPALQSLAVELGVTASVEFTGWLTDLNSRYRTAGIFLAPAPGEPCGLSILEAMAWATPVVAAGAAGHLETVGRAAGAALFEPGDHQAAAALLVRLAAEDDARQAYGESLRALQRERFNLDRHVEQLEVIYGEVSGR